MERQSTTAKILIHLAALCLAAVMIAPVLWLFVMSISSPANLSARPLIWWPDTVDFSRYATLLSRVEALRVQLDSDDYHPDGEAVAEGLLKEYSPAPSPRDP